MPGGTAAFAIQVLERLRREMAPAIRAAGVRSFTTSSGVADSSMSGGFDQLIRSADDALYRSMETGRDRATFGDPALAPGAKRRRGFEPSARIGVRAFAHSD